MRRWLQFIFQAVALAAFVVAALSGCATQVGVKSAPLGSVTEQAIGTDCTGQKRYHAVLYYPQETALSFKGYVVGVEKSPRDSVTRDGTVEFSSVYEEQSAGIRRDAMRLKHNPDLMQLSHIVKDYGKEYGEGNCALYSVYTDHVGHSLMPIGGCKGAPQGPSQERIFTGGWVALETLRQDMAGELARAKATGQPYTHLMVVVMGWNTVQTEAVRNFNSIVGQAVLASGKSFRPLFVGLTWPSEWDVRSELLKAFSFKNKKDDADEVGLSWLGALLHGVIGPLGQKEGLPSVVVGHSFGARATSMAACAGTVLPDGRGMALARSPIDLLVSLQGAYAINRITGAPAFDESYFPQGCSSVKHIALTASKNDAAVAMEVFADFTGETSTYRKTCSAPASGFQCLSVAATGEPESPLPADAARVYLEASKLVAYNAFDTGGKAHSDIYRREMGMLIWRLVQRYAPGKGQ